MGKTLTEQKKLQQIDTGTMQVVSQKLMNLGNLDDFMKQKQEQQKKSPLIIAPKEDEVIAAHKEVGLSLQPSSKKHPQRVKRAEKKNEFQHALVDKSSEKLVDDLPKEQVRQHFADLEVSKLLFAKDKKNVYETLLSHYTEIKQELSRIEAYESDLLERKDEITDTDRAKLATLMDVRAFYTLHERLMTNKYYVMLPHAEMHKLSSDELRKRLDALYKEKDKNGELIEYYQDLVRLQQLGLSDAKSVTARQKEYLDQLKPKTEKKESKEKKPKDLEKDMKNIQASYVALKKRITGELAEDGKESRLVRDFFRIYGPDIAAFVDQSDDLGLEFKDLVREYQIYEENKEVEREATDDDAIEAILKKADDDVDKIDEDDGKGTEGITLSKEQVESSRQVDRMLFDKAISDDQLSFSATLLNIKKEERLLVYYMVEKGKMVQNLNGEDFLGVMKNYVPDPAVIQKKANWKNLSVALRSYKHTFEDIAELAKLEKNSQEAMEPVEKDRKEEREVLEKKREKASRTAEEKEKALQEAIQKKLDLVSMLYAKAGMPLSMPPDMAKDEKLRERLISECNSLMGLGVALKALSERIAEEKNLHDKGTRVKEEEHETGIASDAAITSFLAADQSVEAVLGAGSVFGDLKMYAAHESLGYKGFSNMNNGLLSVFGFLMAIQTSVKIGKDASLSGADRAVQSLNVSGDFATAVTGGSSAFYTFALRNVPEKALSAVQASTKEILGAAVAGAMIIAGTLKIASSSVQIGRARSTEKDIEKSRTTLDQKAKKDRTRDEKILARFLSHQTRDAKRQKTVASLDMVSGAVTAATGALMLAGPVGYAPLAILGLLGIGLSIAKLATNCSMKKKNRKAAVDDFLRLEDKFQLVLAKKKEIAEKNHDRKKIDEKKLKEEVRKDALAKLGYTSYMDCFRSILAQAAELLYIKNFVNVPEDKSEREMYQSALASVGLKMDRKKVQGEEPKPSAAEIYKKLLSAS